jgi:hypothetical protein
LARSAIPPDESIAATTYNALFIKGDVGAAPAPSEESPF